MLQKTFDFDAEVTFDDSPNARANYDLLIRHMTAEYSGDLEATMATIHPVDPFQILYATGMEVWGYENVHRFYAERLDAYAAQSFFPRRVLASHDCVVARGWCQGAPEGIFFGAEATGKPIFYPLTVWIHVKDGLIKGEAGYCDGVEVRRQLREGRTGDVRAPIW